jgi:hypothetical protein
MMSARLKPAPASSAATIASILIFINIPDSCFVFLIGLLRGPAESRLHTRFLRREMDLGSNESWL